MIVTLYLKIVKLYFTIVKLYFTIVKQLFTAAKIFLFPKDSRIGEQYAEETASTVLTY
jgi:hypothetical protein